MSKKLKIGLDIHGVIDAKPELFAILTNLLVDAGHEVHVLTGSKETEDIHEELLGYGIKWTHFFSITDYCISGGVHVWYDEKNTPWMDQNAWEKAKGEYCTNIGMDLHIDDTIKYADFFKTPFCRFFSKHIPLHVEEVKSCILEEK